MSAIQQGKATGSPKAMKAAKEMSKKDVKDFASTKHEGLPKKIKEDISFDSLCETLSQNFKLSPLERVNNFLQENNIEGTVEFTGSYQNIKVNIQEAVMNYNSISEVATIVPNGYELNKKELATYIKTSTSGKLSDVKFGDRYLVKGLDNAMKLFV